jgi:hypothetical protein
MGGDSTSAVREAPPRCNSNGVEIVEWCGLQVWHVSSAETSESKDTSPSARLRHGAGQQ